MVVTFLLLILGTANGLTDDGSIGCYHEGPELVLYDDLGHLSLNDCKGVCRRNYYRFVVLRNDGMCLCGDVLGREFSSTRSCLDVCADCPLKNGLYDVFSTGVLLPGPPQNLKVDNITDTTAYISWKPPRSYGDIISYEINTRVHHTFSRFSTPDTTFWFSNNTLSAEINFLPGTVYNVTVSAVSKNGNGPSISNTMETLIAYPDNTPSTPIIHSHNSTTMFVELQPVINNNGPISAYQIAVINEGMNQVLVKNNLKSYSEAKNDGLSYYITAEIAPQDIYNNFTIGDGLVYGGYLNAVLEAYAHYEVLLGVVSKHNNVTKTLWGNTSNIYGEMAVNILPLPAPEEETPGIIVGLSVAIAILTCLLVGGIIGFFILTRKISNRRRRLTDNQELTMQGPIIEIENTGYVPEEEILPTNHYDNLKQQLWSIPQSFLKIDPTNRIGIGKFGRINTGTVMKDNVLIPVAIYTIPDKKLGQENKRLMLKDIDILLRSKKHENILALIGTCENTDTLFVVLEQASMNLKDLLLGSRDALQGQFSNMQESQALAISIGIACGMKHLESLQIIHRQLCARNILITSDFVPKVSGYGLAQYYNRNMVPDYTRWTAAEVFKTQQYVSKCDVWSFACLLWEICVLGGTPYAHVPNNEIPEKIMRGLRLNQLRYISGDLYQLMLNCWQLDLDERPTFKDLAEILHNMQEDTGTIHLNFNLYPEFQYEQFYPDMELAARTVF